VTLNPRVQHAESLRWFWPGRTLQAHTVDKLQVKSTDPPILAVPLRSMMQLQKCWYSLCVVAGSEGLCVCLAVLMPQCHF
jgi:hypothetical protein